MVLHFRSQVDAPNGRTRLGGSSIGHRSNRFKVVLTQPLTDFNVDTLLMVLAFESEQTSLFMPKLFKANVNQSLGDLRANADSV